MSVVGALCVFLARIDGEVKEAGQQQWQLRQERHSQSEPRVGEWLSAFFKKAAR